MMGVEHMADRTQLLLEIEDLLEVLTIEQKKAFLVFLQTITGEKEKPPA